MRDTTVRRFLARVDSSAGAAACWPWTGRRLPNGYGLFDAREVRRAPLLAHRVAWFVGTSAWPDVQLHVCHRCDNPCCVNPAHLFLGTDSDNMLDASRKQRLAQQRRPELVRRGARHHAASLTEDDVCAIDAMAARGVRQRDIALHFGVSQGTINFVINRGTWKHVPRATGA